MAQRDPRVDPRPGDRVIFDGDTYEVTAVGSKLLACNVTTPNVITPTEWMLKTKRARVIHVAPEPTP